MPGTTTGRRPGPSGARIDLGDGSEPSLAELISATTHHLSELVRDEVELAKLEIKEEASVMARAGALMGSAAVFGYLCLTLLCFAAAWGLAEIMPTGVAFLLVGVVIGIVAFVMFTLGKRRMSAFDPVPHETIETLQEDVTWAKHLRS